MRGWWRQRKPEVTICLSAYQSERFVDRAVNFARGQTHKRTRILISVDKSSDNTAAICEAYARHDPSIEVVHQREHLGWAGNANYLLSRVDTEFYFFYFHDDIILPQYTEVLLGALREDASAVSVHCDMDHFGGSEHISFGRTYRGSAAERLVTFLVAPERGSPLRSLTRRDAVGAIRMPTDAVGGLWANEPYLLQLLAAGPAIHIPQKLYLRWDQRSGGLTDGWKGMSHADLLASYRANVASAIRIIDGAAGNEADREVMIFCLQANTMHRVWKFERQGRMTAFTRPEALSPEFSALAVPAGLAAFPAEVQIWVVRKYESLIKTRAAISKNESWQV